MINHRASLSSVTDNNFNRSDQVFLCDIKNRLWKSSTKHYCLSVSSTIVVNSLNLRPKSHIKHSVCLIKHKIGYTSKISYLTSILSQNINHSSWGTNNNFNSSFKFSNLVSYIMTSNDATNSLFHTFCK